MLTQIQFSDDEEDSEDEAETAVDPPTGENQRMRQSSSTEGRWASKDGNRRWSTSPRLSRGRLSSAHGIKMTPAPTGEMEALESDRLASVCWSIGISRSVQVKGRSSCKSMG